VLEGSARGYRALINCAGRAPDVGRDLSFRRANLAGTVNVCRAIGRAEIGRLVHVSTTDVYGVANFEEVDEDTRCRNNRGNPYPKYKILAERALGPLLPPHRRVILRPGLVWGPGDVTVLPRVLAFLRSSRWIVHFGRWRGANRWPLAYIGNVARMARAAATWDDALGETYNVVDPEITTMDEYYRMLAKLFLPDAAARRSVSLPYWTGFLLGAASTTLSALLDLRQPVLDPSLYGLQHVAHDQHFSGAKAAALLARHGDAFLDRASALRETATAARSPIQVDDSSPSRMRT
jgi:nucleoside-diphosphate-sugar epimerase